VLLPSLILHLRDGSDAADSIVDRVDVDFFNVRVRVTDLPLWSKCWSLAPKANIRPEDASADLIALTSEPCILLVPAAAKDLLIQALTSAGSHIVPGLGSSVSQRPTHIWVAKLVDALHSVDLSVVRLLAYGHKQPLRPFNEQLHLAPRVTTMVWEFSPGISVDLFRDDNTYDVGITFKTPHLVQIFHAEAIPSDLLPALQIARDLSSPLHAVSHLNLSIFPMFSDMGNGFGSLKITPRYDRHAWQPLYSVHSIVSPSSLLLLLLLLLLLSPMSHTGDCLPLRLLKDLPCWPRPLCQGPCAIDLGVSSQDLQDHPDTC
jgi:hypothetical protein